MLAVTIKRFGQDRLVLGALLLATCISALCLPVNPWPRDYWFQTQYWLFGSFPGQDNYTPVAAPAVFYKGIHLIAVALNLSLRGELYLASLAQNGLLFFSAFFVYRSCKRVGIEQLAGLVAVCFLVFLLSAGLPQAFWSENLVLFLFSVVLYYGLKTYYELEAPVYRFWSMAVGSSLLIGALTITRMTPVFIIPALFFLFYRRLSHARLLGYITIASVTTGLALSGLIASNEARFGQAELTSSSGRHLWQGVSPIIDQASLGTAEYIELKELNGSLRGKNYWDVRFSDDRSQWRDRDELLGRIARDAIRTAPFLYLRSGLMDFVTTIGRAPYRLGFGERRSGHDPFNIDMPLPAIATFGTGPSALFATSVANSLRYVYFLGRLLYPIAIFLVLSTYAVLLFQRARLLPIQPLSTQAPRTPGKLSKTMFATVGLLLIWMVNSNPRMGTASYELYVGSTLCVLILMFQLWILHQGTLDPKRLKSFRPRSSGIIYTFAILFFCGSLWFNWQVESNNTRNVIPYLPFLTVMLCLALSYWKAAAMGSAAGTASSSFSRE
jgi:hypothetical protein